MLLQEALPELFEVIAVLLSCWLCEGNPKIAQELSLDFVLVPMVLLLVPTPSAIFLAAGTV